jgi:plasmid stability protein
MYEKVIERLLWNTAQHEYSTYDEVKEVLRTGGASSTGVKCSETHSL